MSDSFIYDETANCMCVVFFLEREGMSLHDIQHRITVVRNWAIVPYNFMALWQRESYEKTSFFWFSIDSLHEINKYFAFCFPPPLYDRDQNLWCNPKATVLTIRLDVMTYTIKAQWLYANFRYWLVCGNIEQSNRKEPHHHTDEVCDILAQLMKLTIYRSKI